MKKNIASALALCMALSDYAQSVDNFVLVKKSNGVTLGYSPDTDMARAYVDGFQTSYGEVEIKDCGV